MRSFYWSSYAATCFDSPRRMDLANNRPPHIRIAGAGVRLICAKVEERGGQVCEAPASAIRPRTTAEPESAGPETKVDDVHGLIAIVVARLEVARGKSARP